ncbi:MAG TPA: hypothetical protein VLX29_01805 [Nitrospirota bacterium]|nr:hypothetical protein [Nitrospirota bacterium]
MSEEKDKVRSQLLDFEMNGSITQRQKDVMAREIDVLLQDGARQRDALEVVHLQEMQEQLNAIKLSKPASILDYIKEVFGEGQQIAFTIFDIIGIILLSLPSLANG